MTRLAIFCLTVALTLTGCERSSATPEKALRPLRIVSLDYCADQYVLKLADHNHILALSPDAGARFSYMREASTGIPQVRPLAENIIVMQPDLIVRSYGGGPKAVAFFEKAGIPVLQIGYANGIEAIRTSILEISTGLGERERGVSLLAEMDARLKALEAPSDKRETLYMTPGGVTAGPATLTDEMFKAAGLSNFQKAPGWRPLPLERLAYERPDLIAAAFFKSNASTFDTWSAGRHPVARRQMEELPTVYLDGATTSCGGWFLLDAIEALAAASKNTGASQ